MRRLFFQRAKVERRNRNVYMQNMMGNPKKMVGTDRRATVTDCPALNKLIPDYFQQPLMDTAIVRQKPSEKPTIREAMYKKYIMSFSKPKQKRTREVKKTIPFMVQASVMFLIFFQKKVRSMPQRNQPPPSMARATKVRWLSYSSSRCSQYLQNSRDSYPKTKLIMTPVSPKQKNMSRGAFLLVEIDSST